MEKSSRLIKIPSFVAVYDDTGVTALHWILSNPILFSTCRLHGQSKGSFTTISMVCETLPTGGLGISPQRSLSIMSTLIWARSDLFIVQTRRVSQTIVFRNREIGGIDCVRNIVKNSMVPTWRILWQEQNLFQPYRQTSSNRSTCVKFCDM
jgi:hypothetical protein